VAGVQAGGGARVSGFGIFGSADPDVRYSDVGVGWVRAQAGSQLAGMGLLTTRTGDGMQELARLTRRAGCRARSRER
jgi:hypothetical protein